MPFKACTGVCGGTEIPSNLAFCLACWEKLPRQQRARINRAARRLERRPERRDRLKSVLATHEEARVMLREQEEAPA